MSVTILPKQRFERVAPPASFLGSGTYNMEYWYQFCYFFDHYHDWLKQLLPETVEQIAYRNAIDLLATKPRKSAL